MAHIFEVVRYCDEYLEAAKFRDASPNGWQVLGRRQVNKLATAVSASLACIEAARDWGADALLVHHGLFWDNLRRLTESANERLKHLYLGDMSLLVYHLPLDAHQEVGNNVRLAAEYNLAVEGPIGEGCVGVIAYDRDGRRYGICSGAGHVEFEPAMRHQIDVFLTGEGKESLYSVCQERGVELMAIGHYNSEKCGVQALGAHLADRFGLRTQFFDAPNPY